MAYTRTRLQLRKSLSMRMGIHGSDGDTASKSLTATVLNEMINDALQESYEIMVGRWEDYYTKVGSNVPFVVGTAAYTMPTDYYKLRKLERQHGSDWVPLLPTDLTAQHIYPSSGTPRRYRQAERSIYLIPAPSAAGVFRMFYIPIRAELTLDADVVTFDVPTEQKLLLAIAWRDCLDAQDLDPSPAIAKIEMLKPLLRSSADGRDAAEPFYLDPAGPPGDRLDDFDGEVW